MKVNDIIVCVDNKLWGGGTYTIYPLTINKQYKVLYALNGEVSGGWVLIKCDDGSQQHFVENRFITLREYNLNKLKI